MPELPEVETSCRGIEPHCVDQLIEKVTVRQRKLRWPIVADFEKQLTNQVVAKVSRRGKYLLLRVNGADLMIHLGMSGSLRIVDKKTAPDKHDHVDIQFANGKLLRFNDPRRFGSFIINRQGLAHELLCKLGPEPLSEDFSADYLYQVAKARKAAIKAVIMNSHVVVGVGNIYAQEALFKAAIHPNRAANKISKARIAELVDAIKIILQAAIKAGGSTLKDFTKSDGKPGYFQHSHSVYGRQDEPCLNCSRPLKHMQLAQRSTVYCGYCQR